MNTNETHQYIHERDLTHAAQIYIVETFMWKHIDANVR